jgi:hypothetical protein
VLNGAKNTKKEEIALRLSANSDCIWVNPYTDRRVAENQEEWEQDEFIHLNEKQLSDKMEREVPLAVTEVNGHRYVFFVTQFRADFCVIIGDDRLVTNLKNNWKGDLVTVRVHSDDEKYSERSMLKDSEFDIVYNIDRDDYDDLESEIEYR